MRKVLTFGNIVVLVAFAMVLFCIGYIEKQREFVNSRMATIADVKNHKPIVKMSKTPIGIVFTLSVNNMINNIKTTSKKIEVERKKKFAEKKKIQERTWIQNPRTSEELLNSGFKITDYEIAEQFESSASWYGGSDCNGNYTYDGKVQFYDWKEIVASEPSLVGEIIQIAKVNSDGSLGPSTIHIVHDTGGAYNCNNPYLDKFVISGKSKTFTRRLDLSKQLLANLGGNPRIANGIPVGKIPTIVRVLRKKPHLLAQKGT